MSPKAAKARKVFIAVSGLVRVAVKECVAVGMGLCLARAIGMYKRRGFEYAKCRSAGRCFSYSKRTRHGTSIRTFRHGDA